MSTTLTNEMQRLLFAEIYIRYVVQIEALYFVGKIVVIDSAYHIVSNEWDKWIEALYHIADDPHYFMRDNSAQFCTVEVSFVLWLFVCSLHSRFIAGCWDHAEPPGSVTSVGHRDMCTDSHTVTWFNHSCHYHIHNYYFHKFNALVFIYWTATP